MGKTLTKSSCCAGEQTSSNLTISGELDKISNSHDDEPILTNNSLDESHELPALSISLNFACNYIQLKQETQEWPVSLSVECPDQPLENRLGVDILCLVETSIYLRAKENLIKNLLEFLMNRLTGQDRLSIVSFNDSAKKLSPFVAMTFTGKLRTSVVIQNLEYTGSCELETGLNLALDILANRRNANACSHLIILSTGLDNNSNSVEERVGEALRDFNMRGGCGFTGHVFALADPAQVLNFIGEETNGTCYLSENEEACMKNFAYCCGIIESKIAEDIIAEIIINHNTIPIAVSKVYSENGEQKFRMPDALAGSKMDTIFVLTVLPCSSFVMNNELLTVEFRYKVKGIERIDRKVLEVPIISANVLMREIEIDEDVLIGFYRVKAADILNEASSVSDLELSKYLLRNGAKELNESCVSDHELLRTLYSDLLNSVNLLPAGRVIVRNLARNHWSKRVSSVRSYQNSATIINRNRMKTIFNID